MLQDCVLRLCMFAPFALKNKSLVSFICVSFSPFFVGLKDATVCQKIQIQQDTIQLQAEKKTKYVPPQTNYPRVEVTNKTSPQQVCTHADVLTARNALLCSSWKMLHTSIVIQALTTYRLHYI